MPGPGRVETPIHALRARGYTIPTDRPEADGTMRWADTTLVLAEAEAGGMTGIGYTYSDACIVPLIAGKLADVINGHEAMDVAGAWDAMQRSVRNLGRQGLAATAISAVDAALWDLKAKLLGLPLATLLGRRREAVPIYGSGGFTTYSDAELHEQLARWVEEDGVSWVKMKVGAEPARDPHRVEVARAAIGDRADLFVDANGACTRQQAVAFATKIIGLDVCWFEEPVSSDDLAGLRFVRQHAPPGMEVAAGEYGYDIDYFRRMLESDAVDVQQADASRCGGVSGFLQVGALCEAYHTDLSAHCAPAMHLHAACAAQRFRHLEWFHDHARIERILFDGAPVPRDGLIRPDLSRPGHGLEFRHRDAERYAAA
ncbi:mandelate racemase [Roseomonas sp. NAR14]|uniref:Mandelate racemase n=1 Tax=Roseomonas acroporae TaxID=2937791 RepID=A0A9X1YAX4_9PROT|nr:enolase C-terminal domain-like protein [Roseomonas acroporae]MCK8787089.1 mandelate racemase [Roseomonas acroporae]